MDSIVTVFVIRIYHSHHFNEFRRTVSCCVRYQEVRSHVCTIYCSNFPKLTSVCMSLSRHSSCVLFLEYKLMGHILLQVGTSELCILLQVGTSELWTFGVRLKTKELTILDICAFIFPWQIIQINRRKKMCLLLSVSEASTKPRGWWIGQGAWH